jgi:predicted TIM-barrel fold metal-dependent hydrolase
MPYAEGRTYYDADSHVMETADWLINHADRAVRDRLKGPDYLASGPFGARGVGAVRHSDEHWAKVNIEANLLNIKGWDALGAYDSGERSRALDLLGFHRQLVFSSIAISQFWGLFEQRERDPEILYGGARAHNRAMTDFCAHDKRLMPVGFVPLDVPELAAREVDEAIKLGCAAVQLPATAAGDKSPTHPDFDRVWARLEDANIPFMLHVGSGELPVPAPYNNNGRPPAKDFLGGDGGGETLRSKGYMMLHQPSEMFLSAMVLDGTFEQFPRLRGGCIAQGAMWVVPWLKRLDAAQETFVRTEPGLALPLKASEYVRRQLRFTPVPIEPIGWMIEQGGAELFLFSSDYPHIEGGRNPLKRFESSMAGISGEAKDRFYSQNFADMMAT